MSRFISKKIIHAVGPDFGFKKNAFRELFDAYYNSLCVLMENELHSISFPLISAGIFGGNLPDPAYESAKQCFRAYKKFKLCSNCVHKDEFIETFINIQQLYIQLNE